MMAVPEGYIPPDTSYTGQYEQIVDPSPYNLQTANTHHGAATNSHVQGRENQNIAEYLNRNFVAQQQSSQQASYSGPPDIENEGLFHGLPDDAEFFKQLNDYQQFLAQQQHLQEDAQPVLPRLKKNNLAQSMRKVSGGPI